MVCVCVCVEGGWVGVRLCMSTWGWGKVCVCKYDKKKNNDYRKIFIRIILLNTIGE